MIEFKEVCFSYKKKTVLSNFSLKINPGERVCLTGSSGIGKTTVLKLILGLIKPNSGSVSVDGIKNISVVFQEDRLIPSRTVLDNVALFSDREKAEAVLSEVGLYDAMGLYPESLSGGMKRRVALARALAHDFDLLCLDEAITGLDEFTAELCYKAIEKRLKDKTLVMVSHNPFDAKRLLAENIEI